MSRNRLLVPEAKKALNELRFETAREVGIDLPTEDSGDKTSKENGLIGGIVGGQMTKRMIEEYELGLCKKK